MLVRAGSEASTYDSVKPWAERINPNNAYNDISNVCRIAALRQSVLMLRQSIPLLVTMAKWVTDNFHSSERKYDRQRHDM